MCFLLNVGIIDVLVVIDLFDIYVFLLVVNVV